MSYKVAFQQEIKDVGSTETVDSEGGEDDNRSGSMVVGSY